MVASVHASKKTQEIHKTMRPLQRFALFFFSRPRFTALIALAVFAFGILSYTTLLTRQGFPSINVPLAIGQGTYLANDPAKVDRDVAKPLSDFLLKQPGVSTVRTTSLGNFYTIVVQYDDSVDAGPVTARLSSEIKDKSLLPQRATLSFDAAKFGYTQRGDDAVISFISSKDPAASTASLVAPAQAAAQYIVDQHLGLISSVSIINPYETAQNPLTGVIQQTQTKFERYGERDQSDQHHTQFFDAVAIGLMSKKGSDTLKYDNQIQSAVDSYNAAHQKDGYEMRISASFAPGIRQQINELQKTLLEGLFAVLLIGSIVIAVRASFITVLSLLTIIFATLGLLELIGYSLNTITLFSLILGLSLIVDDTIIVVEALDTQRRRKTERRDIVATAVQKVGRAMIAATSTAALSFAPLLFVGGILGSFIRAIPVTIISALLISLTVALVIIPLYARYILLGDKHIGTKAEHEIAASFEAKIARWLSTPMLWAQHSRKKIALTGSAALLISFLFIGTGVFLFTKVTFNIFPPAKDTNQISATLTFPTGTTMPLAEATADRATKVMGQALGGNFSHAANYGMANAQTARFYIDLTNYNDRKSTAPQLNDELKQAFKGFQGADLSADTVDVGPPPADFTVHVLSDSDTAAASTLAQAIASYLRSADLRRIDGSMVALDTVSVANSDVLARTDSKAFVGVTAKFIDTDTSALVTLAKTAVQKAFPAAKVASYGLPKDAVQYDFGTETQNQNSFKTMIIAFPILLAVIYIVLAFQFRSLLQPLLIFMAIPFSLFGITLGLYLTHNAFSFFAMLGFFALIGLSLKNTILLTDYANQSRRAGMSPVEAAHEALAERFRPLIATSLTAMVSLIPLALTSPFWQGLAVVLIFGLLSSTFLVVTVFPYYYLGGEMLRGIVRRRITTPLKTRLKKAS